MAREYGRLRLSIGADRDFERLTPAGQWLFARIMVPEPTLNYCGVFDWRPNRLISKAAGLTVPFIEAAAAECEQGRFLLFDLDTDEALARSYIRSEELLRNPKMAVAVCNAFYAIASRQLRAVVVEELQRVRREQPDYSSWSHPSSGPQLQELLSQDTPERHPYSMAYTHTQPVLITNGHTVQNGNAQVVTIGNADPVPNGDRQTAGLVMANRSGSPVPVPTPIPAPNNGGGYVTGEQDTRDPHDEPPPPRYCSAHPNGTSSACGDCQAARKANADWVAARDAAQRQARQRELAGVRSQRDDELAETAERAHTAALAVANCELCDDDGYTSARLVCDHREHSTAQTRAAARAKVAAALQRTPAAPTGGDVEDES